MVMSDCNSANWANSLTLIQAIDSLDLPVNMLVMRLANCMSMVMMDCLVSRAIQYEPVTSLAISQLHRKHRMVRNLAQASCHSLM